MGVRRRCPVCRSKQWHKEPSSGLITCGQGHVLQNYRNETTETTELGPHALRKRTLKSGRKKKERESKADPKLYHGARARFHYFQCLQIILRKQASVLIKLWDLPQEFEIVCRDTWALHLSLLSSPPPAEPFYHNRQQQESQPINPAKPRATEGDDDEDETMGSSHNSSSTSLSENEEDQEIAELLRENSDLGSSSEEDGGEPAPQLSPAISNPKWIQSRHASPASTVAVLVLSCWMLRIPIIYRDFINLIVSYELPYLDSIRFLPTGLTEHLAKHTVQALSPHHPPATLVLHGITSRLARLLNASYGVVIPEANAAPILWRTVRHLGGTPTLYLLTKTLARTLSVPVTLHRSLASGLTKVKTRDPAGHKSDDAPPEIAFVAVAVIVLKMIYGLDGKKRQPRDELDPAYAMPQLSDYLELIQHPDDEDRNSKNSMFSGSSVMAVQNLSKQDLDEYIAFCEKALLGPSSDRGPMCDYFPLRSHSLDPVPVGIEYTTPRALLPIVPSADDDALLLRPGQAYKVYSPHDVLGSWLEEYDCILGKAARWAGVSGDEISSIVERFEKRLVRWWGQTRRRERKEEQDQGGGEEDNVMY